MKVLKGGAAALAVVSMLLVALVAGVLAEADGQELPESGGVRGVPEEFRPWLIKAAEACEHAEITPALLAAQINQESGFSTDRDLVSDAGAQGPAQFMPDTWATWGRDADGNGTASPYDVGDAVTAQGRYMCSLIHSAKTSGYGGDPRALALAGYNAGWGAVEEHRGIPPYEETQDYVDVILATVEKFEGRKPLDVDGSGTGPDALRRASRHLGVPYSWGGGSPAGPSTGFCDGTNGYLDGECVADNTAGFDCSSLVQYAYWPDLHLPRTAAPQYRATSHNPVSRNNLKPGDLLFWSDNSGYIYHVAMYAGDGNILHAPRTGEKVQIEPMATAMPATDYHGATRP